MLFINGVVASNLHNNLFTFSTFSLFGKVWNLKEADFNPIIVNQEGAFIADAKLIW